MGRAERWTQQLHRGRERSPPRPRRLLVTSLGVLLLAAGALMLVLPGPGLLGLFLGFVVLSTEYPWARRLVAPIRRRVHAARERRRKQRREA
ncbi:MAG TPA: PGPGW domain-containing protein [Aggregicoccus sp.]|nr:PGPGW domain-containing protein [Aggregicoccus sp.]